MAKTIVPSTEECIRLLDEAMAEVQYLTWFKQNADFGPADDDVHMIMNEQYTKQTGQPVPPGWDLDAEEI